MTITSHLHTNIVIVTAMGKVEAIRKIEDIRVDVHGRDHRLDLMETLGDHLYLEALLHLYHYRQDLRHLVASNDRRTKIRIYRGRESVAPERQKVTVVVEQP